MIKLKEIEERCKKATTGPWQSDIRVGCMAIYAGLPINCLDGIQNRLIRYKHGVPAPTKEAYWTVDDQDVSDNEFIARSRTDLPECVRLLREYKRTLAWLLSRGGLAWTSNEHKEIIQLLSEVHDET